MSKNDRLTQLVGRKHQHRLCTFHRLHWTWKRGDKGLWRFFVEPKKNSLLKKESFLKISRSKKLQSLEICCFLEMSPLSNLPPWSSHSSLTIVRCFITHPRSSIPTITLKTKSVAVIVIDTLLFAGSLFGKNGSFSPSLFVAFSRIQLAFGS